MEKCSLHLQDWIAAIVPSNNNIFQNDYYTRFEACVSNIILRMKTNSPNNNMKRQPPINPRKICEQSANKTTKIRDRGICRIKDSCPGLEFLLPALALVGLVLALLQYAVYFEELIMYKEAERKFEGGKLYNLL